VIQILNVPNKENIIVGYAYFHNENRREQSLQEFDLDVEVHFHCSMGAPM